MSTLLGQIFARINFREFSQFRDFFQEIPENFSHEKYFLPPFAKINPREKLEIGQFAKLNPREKNLFFFEKIFVTLSPKPPDLSLIHI